MAGMRLKWVGESWCTMGKKARGWRGARGGSEVESTRGTVRVVAGVEEVGGRGTRNEEILSTFPTLHATSYPLHYPQSFLSLFFSLLSLSHSLYFPLFFSFFRISSKASPPPIERIEEEKTSVDPPNPWGPAQPPHWDNTTNLLLFSTSITTTISQRRG